MDQNDANSSNFIPASQRPDGTWRKPRRVKEGYVPQEEVPLYESKGKQFLNRKTQVPTGLPADVTPHRSIPGLFIEEKPPKKERVKKPKVEQKLEEKMQNLKIETHKETQDPVKRLKNMKKRLREIETLENKINCGDLKHPEKEQLEKIARKKDVIKEIRILENTSNGI